MEIPFSFVFAPVMTILLWAIYGGDIVGFNFAAKEYIQKKTCVDDSGAEYDFETTRQKQATVVMKHETPRPSQPTPLQHPM